MCGALLALAASSAFALAGCGGGSKKPPTYPVSGTVTLDGKPVEKGMIQFVPTDPKLDLDQGTIEQGKFAFKSTSGSKKVSIIATKSQPAPPPDPPDLMIEVNYVPAEYNTASTLTAEVKESGPNEYTFNLKSASGSAK